MCNVLIVGQTPPPYHGQAIMIEKILMGQYRRLQLYHVPMRFSSDLDDVGKVQVRKIGHILIVIALIIYLRFRHQITILYYPPAGPNKVPMYRDFAILIVTRWLFAKTVFHFHAGGISTLYAGLSRVQQFLYRLAYFEPDLAVHLSSLNPADGQFIKARRNLVIPYGIEDYHFQYDQQASHLNHTPVLLYVGSIQESKGVLVLLEAAIILKKRGMPFKLNMVGKFVSSEIRERIERVVKENALTDSVYFAGVQIEQEKWNRFAEADIFCFPTFFESETFGLVVLEAMQFALPVVATNWRGVPDLVRDGTTGFLVTPKDPIELADKIGMLIQDQSLAKQMGHVGRQIYLEQYSLHAFYTGIEEAILGLCQCKQEP